MYDLNLLRSFLSTSETLNFSVSAGRLNTVQSVISAHIAKLEQQLETRLFDRGRGRQMSLTAEGRAFQIYARRILSLAEEAENTVRTVKTRRVLRIGTTVTLALSLLPKVLRRLAETHPTIQFHIKCERSGDLLDFLNDDEIDLALMLDQGNRDGRMAVYEDDLVWVCSPDFNFDPSQFVPLAFLSNARDLRQFALAALDDAGLPARINHLSQHPIGVRSFVLAGVATTVMTRRSVEAPLVIAPDELELPDLPKTAIALYHRAAPANEDFETFCAALDKVMS